MALETHTVLGDPAQLLQAEDLEAAGVGENGAGPAHESMQATEALDALVTWPQVEVIGVAEDDAGIELEQVLLTQGLDGSPRAHGHEDRSFDGAVGGVQQAGTGAGSAVLGDELVAEGTVPVAQRSSSARVTNRWPRRSSRGSITSRAPKVEGSSLVAATT